MITMLAALLAALVGIALAIFGVIAAVVGFTWLMWPVIIAAAILIGIGYVKGKKSRKED